MMYSERLSKVLQAVIAAGVAEGITAIVVGDKRCCLSGVKNHTVE